MGLILLLEIQQNIYSIVSFQTIILALDWHLGWLKVKNKESNTAHQDILDFFSIISSFLELVKKRYIMSCSGKNITHT